MTRYMALLTSMGKIYKFLTKNGPKDHDIKNKDYGVRKNLGVQLGHELYNKNDNSKY